MLSLWRRYQRMFFVLVAALLVIGTYVPIFGQEFASATNQLEPRSVQLSDSSPSGGSIATGVGSGTNVVYTVTFKHTDAINSFFIDFCDNSPLIGDTCLQGAEASLQSMVITGSVLCTSSNNGSGVCKGAPAPTSTGAGCTNTVASTNWVYTAINSNATDHNPGFDFQSDGTKSLAANCTETFAIGGITNPDTSIISTSTELGTFYGRIYTYTQQCPRSADSGAGCSGSNGGYTKATTPGTYNDYGGLALAIAQVITISAKVEESLAFCVSAASQTTGGWVTPTGGQYPGFDPADPYSAWSPGDCSSTTTFEGGGATALPAPALQIGELINGNVILKTDQPYSNTAYFQVSTNALNGATVYMHTSNTCGGLSDNGGTSCGITGAGDYCSGAPVAGVCNAGGTTQQTPVSLANGHTNDLALFGMIIGASTDGTSGSNSGTGSLTDVTTYSTGAGEYGMDNTASTGVAGYEGNEIASSTTPLFLVNDSVTFGATASLATPAGIYSTNESLIATGNF